MSTTSEAKRRPAVELVPVVLGIVAALAVIAFGVRGFAVYLSRGDGWPSLIVTGALVVIAWLHFAAGLRELRARRS